MHKKVASRCIHALLNRKGTSWKPILYLMY